MKLALLICGLALAAAAATYTFSVTPTDTNGIVGTAAGPFTLVINPADLSIPVVRQSQSCAPGLTWPGTCSFGQATVPGNRVVVQFQSYTPAGATCPGGLLANCAITSVTDGGDTFTQVPGVATNNTVGGQASWNDTWTSASVGAVTNIVVTPNGSSAGNVFMWELANAGTFVTANGLSSQASTLAPSGPSLSVAAKVICLGALHPAPTSGNPTGVAAPFLTDAVVDGMTYAHQITTVSGTCQPQWTLGTAAPYAATTVAFMSANGGGAPVVQLSSTTVSFPPQAIGVPSAGVLVTLTNGGSAPLSITSIVPASGSDFTDSSNCPLAPATLGIQNSCTITLTFTPTAVGLRNGSVTITDNAANSPQAIALSGNGFIPVLGLSLTGVLQGGKLQ